jgi:hypothetical protein
VGVGFVLLITDCVGVGCIAVGFGVAANVGLLVGALVGLEPEVGATVGAGVAVGLVVGVAVTVKVYVVSAAVVKEYWPAWFIFDRTVVPLSSDIV